MNPIMYDFCRLFHQDCELYGPTVEDWIKAALKMLGKEKSDLLSAHLRELLDSGASDRELADLWNRSPAGIYFRDDGFHRSFFQTVCNMADRSGRAPI